MNITQSSQDMISNLSAHSSVVRSNESILRTGSESEIKLNFQDVMEQAKDTQPGKKDPVPATTDYPLESYALPSWFGSYLPEKAVLTPELNYDFWSFAGKLSEDDIVTEEERNQLRTYLLNDPFHKAELEKRAFRVEFEKEIGEYSKFLFTTFQEILEENNIDSREEYYQNVILDKKNSDKLHMEMDTRLKSNPRVLELMDILLS